MSLTKKGLAFKNGGLAWGATNSGKSYNIAHLAVDRYLTHPGLHFLIGSSLRLLKLQNVKDIRAIARRVGAPTTGVHTQDSTMRVGPSTVMVRAFTDVGDEEFIRSLHAGQSLWAEEVSKVPEVCYDMAVSRCDPDAPKWATCNPTHPQHWAKKRIDAGRWPHEDLWLLDDNPTLTPAEREAYAAQFTGIFHDRMIKGLWMAAEGLVYPSWQECSCEFDPGRPYLLAYDPAPVNTQAALCIQPQKDHYCVVDELYTRRGATLRKPREALEQIRARWGNPLIAMLDPAAYDHVYEATHFMKWRVLTPSTKEHVVTIPILNLVLAQHRLRVNAYHCPNTAAELYSVIYDEKSEKIANGQEDHATDALRYIAGILDADRPPPAVAPNTFQTRWDEHYAAQPTR